MTWMDLSAKLDLKHSVAFLKSFCAGRGHVQKLESLLISKNMMRQALTFVAYDNGINRRRRLHKEDDPTALDATTQSILMKLQYADRNAMAKYSTVRGDPTVSFQFKNSKCDSGPLPIQVPHSYVSP